MDNTTFIQWNCRGLRSNYEEISLLLQHHDPIAISLQETYNDTLTFKGYTHYSHPPTTTNGKPTGGASIIVKNNIPQQQVAINSCFQAVAVKLTAQRPLTICSLYLQPNFKFNYKDLEHLVEQLPVPFIIMGDFNAHSPLWGNNKLCQRGKIVEDFITDCNLSIYNDKTKTYLHPGSGSYTAIDLSLCSPSLYLDFTWRVGDDLCGSDHFPIFLSNIVGIQSSVPQKRFKLKKANWDNFKSLCLSELKPDILESDDPIATFTSVLHGVADKCIPKTSTTPRRASRPWFNSACKEAIKHRKQALARFKIHPTTENQNSYKKAYANSRRIIKKCKRDSWKKYVSSINFRTSIKQTWNMVCRISGKHINSCTKHLKYNNTTADTPQTIAEALASTFSQKSSSGHYKPSFQEIKNKTEAIQLNFSTNENLLYNNIFSLQELEISLKKSKDTSAGPDEIHYQFLKHLPHPSLQLLLNIFNKIYSTNNFPDSWREATIIPIPKPGKDHTDPANYRPIALTSCICKTMERMVNDRLVWYLERNNILSPCQNGFRQHRSTIDQLVRLETYIREGFIKKQHVVAVFFDLEKAYDTTWKGGIMHDLHAVGLRGNLPLFIQQFLMNRTFKVLVGNTFSSSHVQEQGVPQGSILSPILFNLKLNNVVKNLPCTVEKSLYVDDLAIYFRGRTMSVVERQLQNAIDKIEHFADENGFCFSVQKTNCVHFCRRQLHPDPFLKIYGSDILVKSEVKFLGLIFDKKLTFIPHIEYLRTKCQKAMNLLRVVSSSAWGADRTTLLMLYKSLVLSKLDYGCVVYGSARSSYLHRLDPIQNKALRLCLGAFQTSPIVSLEVESGIPSLSARRAKLSILYLIKIKSLPQHPVFDSLFNEQYDVFFYNKPTQIPTLRLRLLHFLEKIDIELALIAPIKISNIPPWLIIKPTIILSLSELKKNNTNELQYKSELGQIFSQYPDYKHIYTDGSKQENGTACAVVSDSFICRQRLPNKASIFTAELRALELALHISEKEKGKQFIIFSDSLASLQSINSNNLENPFVYRIIHTYNKLIKNYDILFCWIPGHTGISGNCMADKEAKEALSMTISKFVLPYNDFRQYITTFIYNEWQKSWDTWVVNKLHEIQPVLRKPPCRILNHRRDESVMVRLRIGHTSLTHSYLLKGEPAPICTGCGVQITVKHILLTCPLYRHHRNLYFANNFNTLKHIFNNIPANKILLFLHAINMYQYF